MALLALASIKGLGTRGLRALIAKQGEEIGVLWQLDRAEIHAIFSQTRIQSSMAVAEQFDVEREYLLRHGLEERERLVAANVCVVTPSEVPASLRNLRDGPRWLFVEGNIDALYNQPSVAVVGTRQPTYEGVRAAEAVARCMAAYPITLVSGLAEGIDAAAHAASLRDGVTNIAFLGHGTDVIFPAATDWLRRRIVDMGGAVVSEYLPKEHYRKQNFVQRNRLQAGLADIVVAVEGKASGGTAHTVRFAQKYGRHLVGIRWPGAGDLLDLVADVPGAIVCDLFDPGGRRQLDEKFRSLATSFGNSTTSLSLVERHLLREVEHRNVSGRDLAQLRDLVEKLLANGGER